VSDAQEPKRPNAHYKLSNENASTDGIVYHYSRERRLEKAPQAVRDLYKAEPQHQRFNLIKPLVRTRPLAMMFATVVVASLLVLVVSVLGLASNSYDLDGNQISVQAIRYEGAIIMIVKKTLKKSGLRRFSSLAPAYSGAVDIAVQPLIKSASVQEPPPEGIFYHKIFFTFENEESYRFTVPFDSGELALVLATEKKTISLTVKAE
jgi:hypothetical protein